MHCLPFVVLTLLGFSAEALPLQHFLHPGGHLQAFSLSEAETGKYLREVVSAVEFNEITALGQGLLRRIYAVYVLRSIFVIMTVVQDCLHRQAVGPLRILVRPSESDGQHRHHQAGQMQGFDDTVRIVDSGAENAGTESALLGQTSHQRLNR